MMGLTWFCLGVLTFVSIILLRELSKRYRMNWISWSGMILGIFFILFCIAWFVGTTLEGVPRAASMGIVFFGMPGVLFLTFTLRYIDKKLEKIDVSKPEETEEKRPTVEKKHIPERMKLGNLVSSGIRYFAYISLIIAFVVGMKTSKKDYETMVKVKFPHEKLTKVNDNPVVFQLGEKVKGAGNYVLIQEGQGYGGPFVIGIRIMDDGKVHEAFPLEHRETPAFAKKIQDARYGNQFIGKHISDDFIVGVDIDAVSGATITTMAATESVRRGAHTAASQYFKLKPTWKRVPWKIGLGEILIVTLFILAFITKIHTKKPWNYIYLTASVIIVGFYLNAAISIGNFAAVVMGYIPGLKDHIIWWILTVGSIGAAIIIGKNVYCFKICPFYGIEVLLSKISGMKLSLHPAIIKHTRFIVNFLLWLSLMIIFLSSHPALGGYEPFAMMFSLEGIGVQWYIFPITLVGAFFMSSYWCRFFCPVGNAFKNILQIRRDVINRFKRSTSEGGNIND